MAGVVKIDCGNDVVNDIKIIFLSWKWMATFDETYPTFTWNQHWIYFAKNVASKNRISYIGVVYW